MTGALRVLPALCTVTLAGCFQGAVYAVDYLDVLDVGRSTADGGSVNADVVATAPEVASVLLCGNGRVDLGGTCATCRGDVAISRELPNYADDNCDGHVDEGFREPLTRYHISDTYGCGNEMLNWDHCMTTDRSVPCACDPDHPSNLRCDNDGRFTQAGQSLAIYSYRLSGLATTSPAYEVTVGRVDLKLLYQCQNARITQHVYVLYTDPIVRDARWSCAEMGYVLPLEATTLSDNVLVWRHEIPEATTVFYSRDPHEADDLPNCRQVDHAPAWYAWSE